MLHGRADLDGALEELYSARPAEFMAKRDALARRLKADGDAGAATALRARRKPTQIAYVLNQLARRHPDDVASLVDVGRDLAREQRKALRGEPSGSFRQSIARQREVVRDVTGKAATLMRELQIEPSGHLDELASALQAALVDPAVGAKLEEGRLEKPPEPAAGFAGPLPSLPSKEKPRPHARPARHDAAKARADKRRTKAEQAARLAAERARKIDLAKTRAALRAAEAEAKKRQQEAEKAELEARRLTEHARRLAEAAEESGHRAEEARKQLVRAEAAM